MASRTKEYGERAEIAAVGGVVCYVASGLALIAAMIVGGVLLYQGTSPLPAAFPLVGSGAFAVYGRRALERRNHWADAAHAERELTEGSR